MAARGGVSSAPSRVASQDGRVAIITGANTGIGLETAAALAAAGAKTVLACRNDERAAAARAEILRRHPTADVELLRLDLADLRQVADAAAEATERFGQIHVIVNNAGLITRSRSVTVDGFETTFGVNHLGHFAWTGHLLPALLAAPDSRVVTVSSLAHLQATMRWDDLMGEQEFKPVAAYRRSKVANLLHSSELQRRLSRSDAAGRIGHHGGSGAPGHRRIDVLGERRGTSTPARRPDLRRGDRRGVQHRRRRVPSRSSMPRQRKMSWPAAATALGSLNGGAAPASSNRRRRPAIPRLVADSGMCPRSSPACPPPCEASRHAGWAPRQW